MVLLSQYCPLNDSQSAVEDLGKLAYIRIKKNIQEYSLALIKIDF